MTSRKPCDLFVITWFLNCWYLSKRPMNSKAEQRSLHFKAVSQSSKDVPPSCDLDLCAFYTLFITIVTGVQFLDIEVYVYRIQIQNQKHKQVIANNLVFPASRWQYTSQERSSTAICWKLYIYMLLTCDPNIELYNIQSDRKGTPDG